jgi:nucleoside-diphosphate-sugar epimerase
VHADPILQNWNLWSYIDVRDAAQAVRLALEYPAKGFATFIIASPDTIMTQSNAELMAKYFPGVPFKRELGPHESMLSSDKARRVLGYRPTHSWRDEVSA